MNTLIVVFPSLRNNLFFRIYAQLSSKRRLQLILSFISVLLNSIAQFFVVSTFYPLLANLSSPTSSRNDSYSLTFFSHFGHSNNTSPLVQSTLVFVLLTFFATLLRLFDAWLGQRLAAGIGTDITLATFRTILYQPFISHKLTNSSKPLRILTSDIDLFVVAIAESFQFCIGLATSAGIIIALLSIGAKKVLFIVFFLCTAFLLIGFSSRAPLIRAGDRATQIQTQKIKTIQEGLGAIRDIIIDRNQDYFTSRLTSQDYSLRHIRVFTELLSVLPRFCLEGFLLIILSTFAVFLSFQAGSANTLAFIGVFALGMQRLLPALNLAYASLSNIRRFHSPILDVLDLLETSSRYTTPSFFPSAKATSPTPLPIFNSLQVSKLSFAYPGSNTVLTDISFKVDAGIHLAITGSTGSGKSTLLDLLMGLLPPTSGSIDFHFGNQGDYILDVRSLLDLSAQTCRCFLTHVPQTIYLADTTILENIAFGVHPNDIDIEAVKRAAKTAHIASFIEAQPDGYYTNVGERGELLSGGQRQRLGIARAVYKNPSVLFLDEATSALDTETERAILANLASLPGMALISVAHRNSVLESSNVILRLHHGCLS